MPRDCNGLLAPSEWQDDITERVAMLQYRALGALTVADDGGDVGVGGSRRRRLVAMLLVRRNSLASADRRSEAVFVGEPASAAHTGPGLASRDLGWSAARNSRIDHRKAKRAERGKYET